MPRKEKYTADYFPHDTKHGKTIYILENRFGDKGYVFWFKILEILGSNDHHFFDCRDPENFEYLLAYTRTTEEEANNILQTLARLKSIHPGLWEEKIIWSQSFIDRLEYLYKRRDNSCLHYSDLCKHLSVKCQHKYTSEGETANRNTQSKVKESKVKESKVKEIVFPWTEKQFIDTWELWKEFKKEQYRFTYKPIGEQGALHDLANLSGGDLQTAIAIIHQSIKKGWRGLFELKVPQGQNNVNYAKQLIKEMQNEL